MAKSGEWPGLAESLLLWLDAHRRAGLVQEEDDDVERHEFGAFWALLAFLAALEKEVEIRESILCYRDTYRLYGWALFNLHENCTSTLISRCLKLITVHFSMGVIFAEPKDRRKLGRKVDVLLMGARIVLCVLKCAEGLLLQPCTQEGLTKATTELQHTVVFHERIYGFQQIVTVNDSMTYSQIPPLTSY